MIAKRVPRNKGKSSGNNDPSLAKLELRNKSKSNFTRLVKYIVVADGSLDPKTWARTADYILATGEEGERVGSFRVTNCNTEDPAAATVLIEATQASNTRSKSDKTYHLLFSFAHGEKPSIEVLHSIEDELCESIGYADHQRISAVHIDTEHLHVHVAINKVHPTGLQNIEPYYDKKRLMEACQRLEIKYDLQRTNHGLMEEKNNDKGKPIKLGAGQQPEQRDSRFRRYLRESNNLQTNERPEAKTLNGLRNLSECHMAYKNNRASMLLQGDARFGLEQGGAKLVDGLRWSGNGNRTDFGRGLGSEAVNVEVNSGIETLAGYVSREIVPELLNATSWKDVHKILAKHGLEIKKHGSGLVIGDQGISMWVRASQCERNLSYKFMTDRLGSFEPLQGSIAQREGAKRYKLKPRQNHPASAPLFAQYQRERQERIIARRHGMEQLNGEKAIQRASAKNWLNTQRMLLKVATKGAARHLMMITIKQQAEAKKISNKKEMDTKRQQLFLRTSMPSWADWLVQKAEGGNIDALVILRSRDEYERCLRGDLLTAERADQAKNVVMRALKPKARKDGTIIYFTVDGGMVIDRKTSVQAQKATAGAALVALELAMQRFDGQALIVEGTEQFRQDVAQLAGLHGFNVSFANQIMELARQSVVATKNIEQIQQQKSKNHNGSEELKEKTVGATDVVNSWIKNRNDKREKISSISYNRLWQSSDAGKVIYQGRRRMEDGSEILLLKRKDEMLIKPSSSKVVAKATKWAIGRVVELDARGRFIDRSNEVDR